LYSDSKRSCDVFDVSSTSSQIPKKFSSANSTNFEKNQHSSSSLSSSPFSSVSPGLRRPNSPSVFESISGKGNFSSLTGSTSSVSLPPPSAFADISVTVSYSSKNLCLTPPPTSTFSSSSSSYTPNILENKIVISDIKNSKNTETKNEISVQVFKPQSLPFRNHGIPNVG
jgi:hypothetical protein